jgi:protein-S-isoprenylcysteine O-methyltransferase Ste14
MKLKRLTYWVRDLLLNAAEILVKLLGWGDVRGFFAHGARLGMVVVLLVMPFATCWSESTRGNRGLRAVKGQSFTLVKLEIGFIVCSFLMPFFDHRNILVLPESDALRYAGLALFTFGIMLRAWVFVYLGRFFSVFLTIQKDHRLVKENVYRAVRHPSYTGLLMRSFGSTLVFRSIFGLAAWFVLFVVLVKRINHEERVLESEFGAEFEDYKRRTRWRLMPGIY